MATGFVLEVLFCILPEWLQELERLQKRHCKENRPSPKHGSNRQEQVSSENLGLKKELL